MDKEGIKNNFAFARDLFIEQNKQESKLAISRAVKALKREYNFDDELINKIATNFESMDESLFFADILDGACMDLNEAWEIYTDRRDCKHETNPFI